MSCDRCVKWKHRNTSICLCATDSFTRVHHYSCAHHSLREGKHRKFPFAFLFRLLFFFSEHCSPQIPGAKYGKGRKGWGFTGLYKLRRVEVSFATFNKKGRLANGLDWRRIARITGLWRPLPLVIANPHYNHFRCFSPSICTRIITHCNILFLELQLAVSLHIFIIDWLVFIFSIIISSADYIVSDREQRDVITRQFQRNNNH